MNAGLEIFTGQDWLILTDRARDAGAVYSYQSKQIPQRHCWIDFASFDPRIVVDLEDWEDDTEWDNSIYRVALSSDEDLFEIVRSWFHGEELSLGWDGLNKQYFGAFRINE